MSVFEMKMHKLCVHPTLLHSWVILLSCFLQTHTSQNSSRPWSATNQNIGFLPHDLDLLMWSRYVYSDTQTDTQQLHHLLTLGAKTKKSVRHSDKTYSKYFFFLVSHSCFPCYKHCGALFRWLAQNFGDVYVER